MSNLIKSDNAKWGGNHFPASFFRLVIILAIIVIVSGCGTVVSRLHDPSKPNDFSGMKFPEGGNPPKIYSGVTTDWLSLEGSPVGALYLLPDMVLSFVADTILLPVTVYEQFFAKPTFQVAAAKGDIRAVNKMLEDGQDINAKDAYGLTALMQAAWAGHPEVVQLLLNKEAAVNEQHKATGTTALMYAVSRNYSDIALLLLNKGATVNTKNLKGESALVIAIANQNAAMVKVLLDKGADINSSDSQGWSALTQAVRLATYFHGSTLIVQMLLDAGADVTSRDLGMSTTYDLRDDSGVHSMLLNARKTH